jgi:tetratricopeptide (TPR) repeat protein
VDDLNEQIAAAYDAHAAGRHDVAEAGYKAVLASHPDQVDALFLLSSLLLERLPESALDLAQSALTHSRGSGGLGVSEAALLDHAAACFRRLDLDPKAEVEYLSRAMLLDPSSDLRLFLLGEAQRRSGRGEDAVASFRRFLERHPGDVNALSNLGALLLQADRNADALEVLQKVVALAPRHLQGWINLATAFCKLNRLDESEDAYRRAVDLDPSNDAARRGLSNIYMRAVPRWHFVMMNDRRRNEAYQAAIERAIRRFREEHGRAPLVLEIGAGSGLLSMMAARAGAEHVVACEMVGTVAEVAIAIVARNGLADRVTVHNKRSSDLVVGVELPRRADILVSEIFDAGLLAENVLAALAHAREHLLTPDATIVPARATVWMMPIQSSAVRDLYRVSNANGCGFDVEPFNRFANIGYDQLALRRYAYAALADPVAVLDFDFTVDVPNRERDFSVALTGDGSLDAWAFWFRLDFDGETFFDTGPYTESTCWAQAVQVEEQPQQVQRGQALGVRVSQTRSEIRFVLADAPTPN